MAQPTTDDTARTKIQAKLELRTGKCLNHSGCGCDMFVPAGRQDGFEVCECTHTKWSHERVG